MRLNYSGASQLYSAGANSKFGWAMQTARAGSGLPGTCGEGRKTKNIENPARMAATNMKKLCCIAWPGRRWASLPIMIDLAIQPHMAPPKGDQRAEPIRWGIGVQSDALLRS